MPLHHFDPVYLWDGSTSRGLIDVEGAARFLDERWPDDRGLYYQRAAKACQAALRGSGSVDAARAALLAAAEDAEILDRKAMTTPVPVPDGKTRPRWYASRRRA